MERKDPPTCKTCASFRAASGQCSQPTLTVFDPVLGRQDVAASAARAYGPCGNEGRLWEARPRPTWWERNFLTVIFAAVLVAVAVRLTYKAFT